ncbi:MAG: 50S ribosomal protein L10 [Actinobacteria bacterium]|nr:50S ribosomal protein L10 [Actinomycetota bacterium]
MNKEQKTAVVEELSGELSDADAIFAIDYRGISVPQAAELRSGLREADARFRVVKNRLTLLAADKAGTEDMKEHLSGPTALALIKGDVALAAKTIRKLGDEWELLDFKGGVMDGAPLDPDSFVAIARLPGRDQLNAQFAGIVASPLTGLVRGLGSMVSGLASQLQQIADQGLVTGDAPTGAGDEPASGDDGAGSEDASTDGEAEDAPAKDDSSDGKAVDQPSAAPAEETPSSDAGDDDPAPDESPEEEPSEEQAPEGEDGGEQVPETGEGDADPGEAADTTAAGDEAPAEETSEDSDQNKEDA